MISNTTQNRRRALKTGKPTSSAAASRAFPQPYIWWTTSTCPAKTSPFWKRPSRWAAPWTDAATQKAVIFAAENGSWSPTWSACGTSVPRCPPCAIPDGRCWMMYGISTTIIRSITSIVWWWKAGPSPVMTSPWTRRAWKPCCTCFSATKKTWRESPLRMCSRRAFSTGTCG